MRSLTLKVLTGDEVPLNYKDTLLNILKQPKGGAGIGAWGDVDELKLARRVMKQVEAVAQHEVLKMENDDYDFLKARVLGYRLWPIVHDHILEFIESVSSGEDSLPEIR